jgi:radical SAM superfamily enzyme YgiQ (UPF0313 family)
MKLLLIDPVTTARSLPVEERKRLRQGIGYPGIGLATVAALTPPDIDIRVIDESVEAIDFNGAPDLVGIAVQAPTAPYAYSLAARFRSKGIPVVLGGIHVSLNPEEAASHADAVVTGEAELTWPELVRDFRKGQLKKMYRAGSLADLDASPVPRRDLLNHQNYRIPDVVQASKGCPYGCEFCSLHSFVGHSPRFRGVEAVVEEIRGMPGNNILFADDNIYCSKTYSRRLFRALAPLGKNWVAESTWHIAFDEETLTIAKQSGCVGLFIGFDSIANAGKLKKVPGTADIEETYIRAIQNIQKKGMAVIAAFVFGLDDDRQSVFERSLRVALKGGANLVNFSVLAPYPGTPVFERLKSEGRITEWNWSKYISPNVCFEPKHMSAAQLKAGTMWAQKEFYSLSNIVKISFNASRKLGWAMGLLSLKLNLAQKKNWGKGSKE